MLDRSNEARAARLGGMAALVGLTYNNADGTLREHRQMHGRTTAFDPGEGFTRRLHGTDEDVTFPPEVRAFQVARPGEYRLRTPGDVAVNPDLRATWTITAPGGDGVEET